MFEQLKQQYLSSFDNKINQLKSALETEDFQALTVQVHQLAGSSGSYGYSKISDLCCEIEAMVSNDESNNQLIIDNTELLIKLLEEHHSKLA